MSAATVRAAAAGGGIPREALPESGDLPWMAAASVAINLLALAVPLLMLQVFDRVLPHRSIDTLVLLVVGTGAAIAGEGLVRYMRASVMVWAAARFEHGAMLQAISRLLAAPAELLERGGYAERFKSIAALREYFSGQTFLQLVDLPFTLLYLGLVAVIGGWIVAVPLVGAVLFGWASFRFGERNGALFRERNAADRRRSNFLVETLTGIHTVKAMAMEGFMLRRYERLQEGCASLTRTLAAALDIASGVGGLFAPMMTVLVVAAGGWLVIRGGLTNGELAACIMLVLRSLGPLQRAGSLWIWLQQVKARREEIVPLFGHASLPEESAAPQGWAPAGRLELREVSYRMAKAESRVIDRVSLAVEPGECMVITGPNGSGHTTLLQLMGGLLRPEAGEVLLDGRPVSDLPPTALREAIAFVPENGQLFQGTILENISGFVPGRAERALHVAKRLGLDRYVARLPRGWDTAVGDSAADTTPVGHRQRIAMVRALAAGARIVLFDAANIALDTEGDAALRAYLASEKGHTTLVIVTHRPSLQKIGDRVLVVEGGRLVEVANLELWRRLAELADRVEIRWHWVRGHARHPKNEYADFLAHRAARDQRISGGLVPSGFAEWLEKERARGKYEEYDPDTGIRD